jgi:hypothetical protein
MISTFGEGTVFENEDAIGVSNCRKSVSNDDDCNVTSGFSIVIDGILNEFLISFI